MSDDLYRRHAALERAVRAHLALLTYPMLAQPHAVAGARARLTRHLVLRGFEEYRESAVLCLTELLSNVIAHVGPDVPVTMRVSAPGGELRIGVTDPDARSLPVLLCASDEAECGRGLVVLTAFSRRWGVQQHPEGKTVWCDPLPDQPRGDAAPSAPCDQVGEVVGFGVGGLGSCGTLPDDGGPGEGVSSWGGDGAAGTERSRGTAHGGGGPVAPSAARGGGSSGDAAPVGTGGGVPTGVRGGRLGRLRVSRRPAGHDGGPGPTR